jgi:hypothetical protein
MRVREESWTRGLSPDISKIRTSENWLPGGLVVNVAAGSMLIFLVALSGECWIRHRDQIIAAVLRLKPQTPTVVVLVVFAVVFAGLNAIPRHSRLPKSNICVIVRGWPYWRSVDIDPVLENEIVKAPLDADLMQDLSDFFFSPASIWKNVRTCIALLFGIGVLTEILVRCAKPRQKMMLPARRT